MTDANAKQMRQTNKPYAGKVEKQVEKWITHDGYGTMDSTNRALHWRCTSSKFI